METESLLVQQQTDQKQVWADAFKAWQGKLAKNTQRAYKVSWELLLAHSGKMPWDVMRSDVANWVEGLRTAGQSAATIRQRMAAIASFYSFASSDYTVMLLGQEVPLHDRANPAGSQRMRPAVETWSDARYLSANECTALLREIGTETVSAKRDYALMLGYIILGRRNSELRLLRWGDITHADNKIWYRWSGKGKLNMRTEMPAIVYAAIQAYLEADHRLAEINPGDYIFTAIGKDKPLSARMVGKLLKQHCSEAGLDAAQIHVHTLRHTAAMLRRQAGEKLEDIQHLLAHSSLNVTQVYLHRLEGKGDDSWMNVAALLGIAAEQPVQRRRRRN